MSKLRAWLARWWWAILAGVGGACALLVAVLVPRRREEQPRPAAGTDAAREADDVAKADAALAEDMRAIEDVLAQPDADSRTRAAVEMFNRED